MADISADRARRLREAATPGPWHSYYNVHGDPFVVADPGRPSFTQIAVIATSPDDYGQADAALIAAAPDLAATVERLSKWKQEAIQVIAEWEKIFEALGRPGRLGESKAAASLNEVKRMLSDG